MSSFVSRVLATQVCTVYLVLSDNGRQYGGNNITSPSSMVSKPRSEKTSILYRSSFGGTESLWHFIVSAVCFAVVGYSNK
jgi:hypothetical protein